MSHFKKMRKTFLLNPRSSLYHSVSPNKGFTLIELLIVITIIGILAGVTLVALGPARQQGREARVISDLYQLQNVAENIYLDEGDYSKVNCATGSPEIVTLCDDVDNIMGQVNSLQIRGQSGAKYCAFVEPNPPSSEAFCVDSYGFADKINFAGITCGGGNYICASSSCPDFNDNGWVDCGIDGSGDPILILEDCPVGTDPEWIGSDPSCLNNCFGVVAGGSAPAECGPGPPRVPPNNCEPCPDEDGNGRRGDECIQVYDLDGDGSIAISDVLALLGSTGRTCQ